MAPGQDYTAKVLAFANERGEPWSMVNLAGHFLKVWEIYFVEGAGSGAVAGREMGNEAGNCG